MKKKIPLTVLQSLEKYVNLKGKQFNIIEPENFLLKIIDNDPDSDFYFNVENYKTDNGLKLLVDRKPFNKDSLMNMRTWIEGKQLDYYFNIWVDLLTQYEAVNSFYDDPIIKAFTEEYYSEFKIVDEDAETNPLKTKQILLLDNHLEYIEDNIEKYQTEKNQFQIQEIKIDIKELRDNLTLKPKVWVIKRISKIWAKLTKLGAKFLKEFVSEAKKQVIKEGVRYIIDQGANLLN